MDDLSMAEADFDRITAAMAAKKVRITIDALPPAAGSTDWEVAATLASDRLARHELGIRGVWVHDIKDSNSTHFIEAARIRIRSGADRRRCTGSVRGTSHGLSHSSTICSKFRPPA
jgi:hypothetical protein